MTFVLIAVFVLYTVLVMGLYTGWQKAIRQKVKLNASARHVVSVIVPIRNEESTIESLLESLAAQNFPADRFEVIVVDDQSTDESVTKTTAAVNGKSNFKILSSSGQGKKAALTEGVKHAKGSLIVTTDADCQYSKDWLTSMESIFAEDSIKMVFGGVRIKADQTFFSSMQAIEFSSLIGSGAATMAYGIPSMSNGANLAFRKDVFWQVNGYDGNDHIASGDDEFLMRKIVDAFPNSIRFNNSAESVVETIPQLSLDSFLSQRLRWAGKWKHHTDWNSRMLAISIFIFHVAVLALPVFVVLGYVSLMTAIFLFLLKVTSELIFLHAVASWLQVRWSWLAFFVLQLLYPVYALYVGFMSLFVKPVWRGRK